MARIDMKEVQAQKREMALRLRKDGHSYEAIGRMLGSQFGNQKGGEKFTGQYAATIVKAALKDIYREQATDLIRIEMERLDDMQLEALSVLRTEHYLIQSGVIVHQNIRDADGKLVMNQMTGLPASQPILDDSPKLAAIDRLLKIQERRSKLLGLDKPTKVAATNPDGDKAGAPLIIVASKEDQTI